MSYVNDFAVNSCLICSMDSDEPITKVTPKGVKNLLQCAKVRSDSRLELYLLTNPSEVAVHNSCRKRFTDLHGKRNGDSGDCDVECGKKLRSNPDISFMWKTMCFLCSDKINDREQTRKVCTLELQETLFEHCKLRGYDSWSTEVKGRVNSCNDLVAEEAVYHVYCFSRFTRHKTLKADGVAGRPEDPLLSGLFDSLCEWLESGSNDELHTLDELRLWMIDGYINISCPNDVS
jgi:hypothetical protein